MKITISMLEEMNACQEGINWFIENGADIEKAKTREELSYFNWFVSRKLSRIDLIKYAVYAAEQVQYLNTDPRVQEAIYAAKAVIDNDFEETRKAAYAAAYAADAAADAAAYAAYAAYAAAAAADAAAYAAAAARAAGFETYKKIIQYGWRLLDGSTDFNN